ncbi:MAG TPA: phosphate ABC transporter permease PstA [Smithellaceae bacterium]|jgi:phosphate transport system permease protein|nr:phosphate ABC transporter permease PstA [Syntrophaceae bacterium]MDX9815367.1 phosphate ABC transporter permease PstA [Smithellaceae bacterium]NMD04963.1 phosphate ABC transporter permease PstA [Deltaproteobacteria bacterium]MBP8609044.1 phosphate ABC transporter permease PstA [Syntrophaceae bacterium]HNQ17563.1 phosphate ABC transporter permease PstA [Smithellaceae bacterium]
MKRRKLEENIFKGMMFIALFLVFAVLAGIILVVTVKGLSSLNLSMIIDTPKGGYYLGKEGGIANAIVGSLYLMAGATFLAFVISLPVALALQKEYLGKRFADFTRLILDILWGTPSIVYGAFGFVVMVFLGLRASLLGGIIVLTLLMIPIMTRAMDETIRLVPFELKEMAYALGTTRMETTFAVVLKQALPGIFTAIILAFGRGIGDAASILFTAGYTDEIPSSLLDPVASLPLAVFFQVGTPVPEVQARAFAAALILLFIVMVINVIARLLGWRFSKNIVR